MIESVIDLVQTYVVPLGGFGVFLSMLVEGIIVPIPSTPLMMASGFFLVQGHLSFSLVFWLILKVAIPAALGSTIGSLPFYFLIRIYGKDALVKWGKYFSVSWQDVESVRNRFEKSFADEFVLFFLRCMPVIPSIVITAFCGLVRMNFLKYFLVTFLGTAVKAFALGLAGWQIGQAYFMYAKTIEKFESTFLVLTILVIVAYVVYRKFIKKNDKNLTENV